MSTQKAIVHFHTSGNTITPVKQPLTRPLTKLPPAIYTAKFHPDRGFYLEEQSTSFTLPPVTFGDFEKRTSKILTTYGSRQSSTGVLFTGTKGSGKSIQCKDISNQMLTRGISTILIQEAFTGSSFNDFIDSIGECVLFIDELGKVYDDDDGQQNSLLTLFDGASSSKRLIVATENRRSLINSFMFDRPGRFFYHFEYSGLEEQTIRDYCTHYNLDDLRTTQLISLSSAIADMTFDVLGGLVEELLRYGESVEEAVTDMNILIKDFSAKTAKLLNCTNTVTGIEYVINPEYSGNTLPKFRIGMFEVSQKMTKEDSTFYKKHLAEYRADEEGSWSPETMKKFKSMGDTSIQWGPGTLLNIKDGIAMHKNGDYVFTLQEEEIKFDYSEFHNRAYPM